MGNKEKSRTFSRVLILFVINVSKMIGTIGPGPDTVNKTSIYEPKNYYFGGKTPKVLNINQAIILINF